MGQIVLREAIYADIPQLLPLIEQLGYPTTLEALQRRFEMFVSNEGYGIVVACDKECVVGWVAWSQSVVFITEQTRIRIEGLVVDKQFRNQGIGKKLMRYLENYASNYKSVILELTSGLKRKAEGTHKFYEALGYANQGERAKVYLRKEL